MNLTSESMEASSSKGWFIEKRRKEKEKNNFKGRPSRGSLEAVEEASLNTAGAIIVRSMTTGRKIIRCEEEK